MARLVDIEDVKNMFRDDTILGKAIREYIDTLPTPMAEVDYDKGLKDAWELALKVCATENKGGIKDVDCQNIFGTLCGAEILRENTYSEALAKLEAYEKEQDEIKVGDEVRRIENGDGSMVVTRIDAETLSVISFSGKVFCINKELVKKTGKHIDIQSMLDSIGGGVDG